MPCCFYRFIYVCWTILSTKIRKFYTFLAVFVKFPSQTCRTDTSLPNSAPKYSEKIVFIKILGATLLFYRIEAYYYVVGIWIQFKANYNFSYVCIFAIFTEIFASSIFIKFGVIEEKFSPNFPMERRIWTNLVSKCSE